MSAVKYPNVVVNLVGEEGNALSIVGAVQRGLRLGGVSSVEINRFVDEALAGDYDHVLSTCLDWVTVE